MEGAFYMNLDRRTDRRAEMEGELNRIGISAERFRAVPTTPGIIGCGISHSAVVREAKRRGYKNVLVLEDDFQFLVEPAEFWRLLEQALKEAPDYDVIMLGYSIQRSEPFSDTLDRVLEAQAGSAYIVNEKMYNSLISTWDEGTKLLICTMEHWNYSCDQIWKRLQPAAKWYAFRTRIGRQRPSIADNGEIPCWADYGI
jgi:glycosyl transferase family 25